MGQKLAKFYELAMADSGLPARMRLAVMTNIPSPKAMTEPDSPENIMKFKAAFKQITGKDAPIH